MNNYKADFNPKNGMIEVKANAPGGSKIFECPIDEVGDVVEAMVSTRRKAEFILRNPLLRSQRVFEILEQHNPGNVYVIAVREWINSATILLRDAGAAIQIFMAATNRSDLSEYDDLKAVLDKINMVVEANKHHLPKSGPARDSINPTGISTPYAGQGQAL